ncbi:MAG TPA: hypothetical protein ENI19_02590 [Candidatus Nealsonbacteria bacterium]|uniref:Uncharacterized protein n=1 Tax=marine sediment metagenome TaxID=412755 RepID=A0A0F9U328_9ZZZZ|nr:hypothetical protein [Candidatus Nealsonbacteria bacterium]HEB46576.1 hypothetical protein [Candidatus Nealsonbacteria bacterium]
MKISILEDNIIWLWFFWYFFEIPKEILKGWRNFLLFNLNYFSIPLLLKTLFSHWKRYYWIRGRGFTIGEYFNVLLSNLMSRFLGALIRIALIIVGLILELFIIIGGFIIFLGWILLPVLLISGLVLGTLLIIS